MEEAEENTRHNGLQKIAGAQEYILPPWRMNEIVLEVISVLTEEEYYKEGFDYRKMIQGMGIKIKKFSSFARKTLSSSKKYP